MPLGIKKVRNPVWQKKDIDSKQAAFRLIEFEKFLYSDKVNNKEKNKRKRDERIVEHDANTDANIEPSKKQKKNNLTDDKLDCKSELIEKRKQLETKSLSKKSKMAKKIKVSRTNDMKTNKTDSKTKTIAHSEQQVPVHIDQCTLPAPISQSSISIKTTAKKPIIEKTSENSVTNKKNKVMALKKVNIYLNNIVY